MVTLQGSDKGRIGVAGVGNVGKTRTTTDGIVVRGGGATNCGILAVSTRTASLGVWCNDAHAITTAPMIVHMVPPRRPSNDNHRPLVLPCLESVAVYDGTQYNVETSSQCLFEYTLPNDVGRESVETVPIYSFYIPLMPQANAHSIPCVFLDTQPTAHTGTEHTLDTVDSHRLR